MVFTRPSLHVNLEKPPASPNWALKALKVLVLRGFIGKPLKKEVDSFNRIEHFTENGREISISDFGFRSTFNEGSVLGFLRGP